MSALPLIMNGVASQGGGGGGTGGLKAVIGAGGHAVRPSVGYDFGNNTCVASGGTGPYTYAWTFTYVYTGDTSTWSTGSAAALDVTVQSLIGGSSVNYICTVQDSAGHTAVSNVAGYTFTSTL